MGLLTRTDLRVIRSWNLQADIDANVGAFIQHGRDTFRALRAVAAPPDPTAAECEPSFISILLGSRRFDRTIVRRRSRMLANPMMHEVFAQAVARYVLDTYWDDIQS